MMRHASGNLRRASLKRGDVWYIQARLPDGRQIQRKLGRVWASGGRPPEGYYTQASAERALRQFLVDADRGVLPTEAQRSGATFRDAVEEWLRYVEQDQGVRATTLREYRTSAYKHLVPEFGDDPIETITTRRIEIWKARLVAEGKLSRRTINKFRTNLHGIFERARVEWNLATNPVSDVKRLKEHYDPDKITFYSKEEIWALVRATKSRTGGREFERESERELAEFAAEQDAAIFLTAAFAGLRMGEVLGLRWRDVDFPNEAVRVSVQVDDMGATASPKGKRVRVVPMVPDLARALAEQAQRCLAIGFAAGDDEPVFVSARQAERVSRMGSDEDWSEEQDEVLVPDRVDRSALRRRLRAAQAQADLRPLRFHDLRHTFGTLAVNYAEGPRELQEWLGHADFRTTQRYLHYKQRGDAARRLAPAFQLETAEPIGDAMALAFDEVER